MNLKTSIVGSILLLASVSCGTGNDGSSPKRRRLNSQMPQNPEFNPFRDLDPASMLALVGKLSPRSKATIRLLSKTERTVADEMLHFKEHNELFNECPEMTASAKRFLFQEKTLMLPSSLSDQCIGALHKFCGKNPKYIQELRLNEQDSLVSGNWDEAIMALVGQCHIDTLQAVGSNEIAEDTGDFSSYIAFVLEYHKIEHLVMMHTLFSHIGWQSIADNIPAELKTLTITRSSFGERESKIFGPKLPVSLRSLDLSHNELDELSIPHLFAKTYPDMETIDLSENVIVDEGIVALSEKLNPGLTALYLAGNEIGDEGVAALASRMPPSLEALDLSTNVIDDDGAIALAGKLPRNLKYITLNENVIGDEAMTQIVEKLPKTLEYLDISINSLTTEGYKTVIKSLPQSLKVFYSNMGENEHVINGEELARIYAKYLPSSIEQLSLYDSHFGIVGAKRLVSFLSRAKSLTHLNLGGNDIEDDGLRAIASHLPRSLKDISLSFNLLSDSGVLHFAEHMPPNLETLQMEANSINLYTLLMLFRKLPKSLQTLDLSMEASYPLTPRPKVSLQLPKLPVSLKSLNLQGTDLSRLKHPENFIASLPLLEDLTLANTNLRNDDLKITFRNPTATSPLSKIIRLDMSENHLSSVGIDRLLTLTGDDLSTLILARNPLRDQGAVKLAESGKFFSVLNVAECELTLYGLRQILQSDVIQAARTLNLSKNIVHPHQISAFKELLLERIPHSITMLHLYGYEFSEDDKDEIREEFPSAYISF